MGSRLKFSGLHFESALYLLARPQVLSYKELSCDVCLRLRLPNPVLYYLFHPRAPAAYATFNNRPSPASSWTDEKRAPEEYDDDTVRFLASLITDGNDGEQQPTFDALLATRTPLVGEGFGHIETSTAEKRARGRYLNMKPKTMIRRYPTRSGASPTTNVEGTPSGGHGANGARFAQRVKAYSTSGEPVSAGDLVKILQRLAARKSVLLANKTLRYGISRRSSS